MATIQVGSFRTLPPISGGSKHGAGAGRTSRTRRCLLALATLALIAAGPGVAGAVKPEGQLTWGVHISLAPTWFDPAETPGIITPFMVLYALHDAMVKPMPGKPLAPSLAESWTVSEDGLTYEFVLRKGATFHNGEPVTAEDVKFSFERYRGTSAKAMKDRVAAVETPDPQSGPLQARSSHGPTSSPSTPAPPGPAGSCPRSTWRRSGDEGYKKAPIGAGPYKFVSFTPGVGAGVRGLRAVLAQDAERQAPGVQGRSPTSRRGSPRSSGARSTSPTRSAASSPRSCSARRGSRLKPAVIQARSGSTSPTSGIRSRRGTTRACGSRPASPSTARPSTRP